jgi:hypothetical protein
VISGRAQCLVCAVAIYVPILGRGEGSARAAAFTVSLEYSAAAPGCPDAVEFKSLVTARLGHDPFRESAPDHVLVRIAPRDGAMDGRIEWRDSAGKWAGDQTFAVTGSHCPRLARAIGFALAVQIQLSTRTGAAGRDVNAAAPEQTAPPPEAAPAGPMVSPVGAIASTEPRAAPAGTSHPPSPALRPGPTFAIGAGASVGFGMSSAPVLLGRLLGAAEWPHASLELAAEVSRPATTRRPDGAGFSQQHLLAGAAACVVVTRWRACLVANAGEVRMAGENIDRPTSARARVVETGARIGVVQRLGRVAFLGAHADGLANLVRWTATLDQVPVWTAPPFAAALGVEAGLRFP